jgi:hypothetical protein
MERIPHSNPVFRGLLLLSAFYGMVIALIVWVLS